MEGGRGEEWKGEEVEGLNDAGRVVEEVQAERLEEVEEVDGAERVEGREVEERGRTWRK